MSETVSEARPDTSEMVALHQVFRDALDAASDLVADAVVDHPGKAEAVAGYYANVLALLRVHHAGLDELLWPRLLERCHDNALQVVMVAENYARAAQVVPPTEQAVADFAAEPSAEHGAAMVGALSSLRFDLVRTLDEVEHDILPLAAEHLSAEEWRQVPHHAVANFTGDKTWLALGLVLDAQDDAQQASTLEHLPEAVREFWGHEGRPQYESFMAALRA